MIWRWRLEPDRWCLHLCVFVCVRVPPSCPGPQLGRGAKWNLRSAAKSPALPPVLKRRSCIPPSDRDTRIHELEAENAMLRMRCEAMLEQGLSQSEDADIAFVFDDGRSCVSGHRGMLCAASAEFRGMFRSGMVESRERRVKVMPGVGVASFRGFLEFVYLGM